MWRHELDEACVAVAWSPDGRTLAAQSAAGEIVLLPADGPAGRIECIPAPEPGGATLAWAPRGEPLLATGSTAGCVQLWRTDTRELRAQWPVGPDWLGALAWSPDGAHLAAAAGRRVRAWDRAGNVVLDSADHASTVSALAWHAGGRLLAAAAYGAVTVHRLGETKPAGVLDWRGSLISLGWSPDTHWLAAGSQESTVQIWRLPHRPGTELAMSGFARKVAQLAWDASSRWLATGDAERIMLWDVSGAGPAGRRPTLLEGHQALVTALAYGPLPGAPLASGDELGTVYQWKSGALRMRSASFAAGARVLALAWSGGRRSQLAVGTRAGVVVEKSLL